MTELGFTLHAGGSATSRIVAIRQAVIAGWTGRDPVARDHHIAELEALGIARPATTPIFYRVAAARLAITAAIEVCGGESSGEVEFVLIRHEGRTYVGVGSDHTDRKLETIGVSLSKQVCDKPVAPDLWPLDEVEAHWDRLTMRSWAFIGGERVLYQEGDAAAMLAPADLVAAGFPDGTLPDGCAMFGGTFAAKGGIRPADRFEFELADPVLGRTIRHGYDVTVLPVLG